MRKILQQRKMRKKKLKKQNEELRHYEWNKFNQVKLKTKEEIKEEMGIQNWIFAKLLEKS